MSAVKFNFFFKRQTQQHFSLDCKNAQNPFQTTIHMRLVVTAILAFYWQLSDTVKFEFCQKSEKLTRYSWQLFGSFRELCRCSKVSAVKFSSIIVLS